LYNRNYTSTYFFRRIQKIKTWNVLNYIDRVLNLDDLPRFPCGWGVVDRFDFEEKRLIKKGGRENEGKIK
jgi:hypothetical protein